MNKYVDAYNTMGLQQSPGFRHRATTDVHAMRMIWNWLEATQTQNGLANVLQERPTSGF